MSDALWRAAIATLHKVEGGLSVDARDPGNWSGGKLKCYYGTTWQNLF